MGNYNQDQLAPYVFGKVSPQALDAECAVLGALMIDKEAYHMVNGLLTVASFYTIQNQKVYSAIERLSTRGECVDLITVTEELQSAGDLKEVPGYYLVELTHRVASGANIEYHARIIEQKHIQRQIIENATDALRLAYEDGTDPFELLEKTQGAFFGIGSNIKTENHVVTMGQATMEALKEIERASSGEMVGFTTGLQSLDKSFGGFFPAELTCIAARPGVGKTELVLGAAMANAELGRKVWFVSLEMNGQQLARRVLSKISGIGTGAMRKGQLSDSDWQGLGDAADKVMGLPIKFAGFRTANTLWSGIRKAFLKGDVDMLIVDYLQLMDADHLGKNALREQQVAACSKILKRISTEFNIPVVMLSQLSRAVESRSDKMPQLSDLRESGAVEQDSDTVIFIYRPEMSGIQEIEIDDEQGQRLVQTADGALVYSRKFRHDSQFNSWIKFKHGHFYDFETSEPFSTTFPAPVSYSEPTKKDGYDAVSAARPDPSKEDIPF